MFYPTSDYTYVDEYGQNIEANNFPGQIYSEYNEQTAPAAIYDDNTFDNQLLQQQQQQQQQYQSVVLDGSQPLAKCSVLYLGTAISSPGQRGIDAIQEPLSRRYPVNGKEVVRGIEAWLAIYENGLQLQFARDPSVVIFYPIRGLVYCASIRFATRTQTGAEFPNGWRFVPLDSPAAARVENTRNPPLFAVTFRRTRHLPVDECFCFVTKTKQAALALVQACFSAYQATTPDQDCSKVPLYFKVDDYGSKNKEIDNEIRIVPAPDRERTLDYQTNTEGSGFFYKTDRVLIDTWQLWEHHKHDTHRSSSNRSCSSSSSRSSHSSSSSCSSCRHARRSRSRSRNRRRRLASIASIPTLHHQHQHQHQQQQQQQNGSFSPSISQSFLSNPTTTTLLMQGQQQQAPKAVDPYAPAPNLIRVERIKDVNSGQDVFIRWVSEPNSTNFEDQQTSNPQQAYATQPPMNNVPSNYDQQYNRDLPSELERLALEDEYLRKSLFDERPLSRQSNSEQKKYKQRSRREKRHHFDDQQQTDFEVVEGFFEDRHGKKRPVKLDRSRINTIKDYRYLTNDVVNASPPSKDRHLSYQTLPFNRPPILEAPPVPPQQVQQTFSTAYLPMANQSLTRPFGNNFLPRGTPYYPPQTFNTTPLFSRPNFINRLPLPNTPFWYRPM